MAKEMHKERKSTQEKSPILKEKKDPKDHQKAQTKSKKVVRDPNSEPKHLTKRLKGLMLIMMNNHHIS